MDTPPPPQRVASPSVLPRFFIAWMSVTMIRQPVAPTGWPRPQPEPFTLVISRLMPSSFSQPDVLAGKGLVELDELEVGELVPRALHEIPHGRSGAHSHDRGVAAAVAHRLDTCDGLQAEFLGLLGRHDDHGGRAVIDARGVAGRDLADLGDEGRGQRRELFHGEARHEVLVLVEDDGGLALLLGDLDGDDLLLEVALLRGALGVVVAPQGHGVHLLAADVVLLGDEFRRMPHDVGFSPEHVHYGAFLDGPLLEARLEAGAAVEGLDHHVVEALVLQAAAPACGRHRVGDSGHVLDAAGEHHVDEACLDHGHAGDDGLHPGDADPVDGHGRRGVGRDPRIDGRHAGHVERVVGLEAAAEAHVVDDGGIDARPLDGLLHRRAGDLVCMDVFQ